MTSGRSNNDGATSLTAVFLMIFSAAILLLLIGMYLIIGLHSENIVKFLKEHTAIVFEISEAEKLNIANISLALQKDERLRPSTIEHISAKEGLEFMQKEMGRDLLPDDMENPFTDLISSYVLEQFTSDEALMSIKEDWEGRTGIDKVYFQNDYLIFWDEWKQRIAKATGISVIFLLIVTILLIFNTVKLSIYTKTESIEILELVGADWNYIRRPFLRVATKMGIISALLSSILIALVLSVFLFQTPGLIDYFNWYFMLVTILILIVIGILLQWVSTYIVVNKSLKQAVSNYK